MSVPGTKEHNRKKEQKAEGSMSIPSECHNADLMAYRQGKTQAHGTEGVGPNNHVSTVKQGYDATTQQKRDRLFGMP